MDYPFLNRGGGRLPVESRFEEKRYNHQEPTWHPSALQSIEKTLSTHNSMAGTMSRSSAATGSAKPSPRSKDQKQVTFELLLPQPQHRARLPMRVMISPHDNTDSIITTVKNFYGLYEGPCVSFQDRDGNILIAAYDNFEHNMTVHVKVTHIEPISQSMTERSPRTSPRNSMSPRKPKLGAAIEMRPPTHPARMTSQVRNRSPSPSSNRSHRSVSTAPANKAKLRTQKSDDSTGYGDNGDVYSDSDGGNGSVTSSRREGHASAEISVDNILEGGRRKRAKFESSELPLFVPPQVPVTTSLSSVSPQRRINGDAASPLPYSNQRTFIYNQPMPSPQSYSRVEQQYTPNGSYTGGHGMYAQQNGHQLRGRGTVNYLPPRQSTGGIIPTPEPTVGSVISDEDVALQLMRLGDASNFSHGRTSTSTADDALSGKADAASSMEESEEEEEVVLPPPAKQSSRTDHSAGPRRKKQRMEEDNLRSDSVESSGDEYNDESFKGESDDIMPDRATGATDHRRNSKSSKPANRPRGSVSASSVSGSIHSGKVRPPVNINSKAKTSSKTPISPASLPSVSRKASLASTANHLGPDEEDLSSKPRCQRCRKSKKGCDRQRPCGRCKDAGIGAEGCVSEDEGNGRRGRYGRHMGVSIKKDGSEVAEDEDGVSAPVFHGQFLAPSLPSGQGKKRKR